MATGYPDGQRLQQQQALDAVYSLTTAQVGIVVSGVFYAGDYGYLAGNLNVAGHAIQTVVQWYGDSAKVQALGSAELALNVGPVDFAKWSVPIAGPYFTVTLVPATGATAYTPTAYFFLTNTLRTWSLTTLGFPVYDLSVNLAAGASQTSNAAQYASGRVGIFTNGGSAGVGVELDWLRDTTPTWRQFDGWTVAANTTDYREVILPTAPTRAILTNPSGAAASNGILFNAWQAI